MNNITETCTKCGKQFLILEQEQKFLQNKGLPLPKNCPQCRQIRRLKLHGERQLYKSTCQKCGKDIVVAFDPSRVTQPIFCKKDYDQYFIDNDPIISEPLPE